jgi:hypothetical protein
MRSDLARLTGTALLMPVSRQAASAFRKEFPYTKISRQFPARFSDNNEALVGSKIVAVIPN